MSKVVILDAGHGGINPVTNKYVTSGKRSPIWEDGSVYYEGVGNRQIANIAAQYLRALGWKVLFTVDPSDYTDVSLGTRIARSNAHFKMNPTAFQISIHSNGFSNEAANGAEVFTSIGQNRSDKIATIWMEEHIKQFPWLNIRADRKDGDVDKEQSLAMNKVNCNSILIETMFHTNKKECDVLMSAKGRELIAIAIVETCERVHKEL